jgi:hypothetical protein
MPACPNCGRQTMRTSDWACQWCGYPLLSRAYKKIDKTFKELQEERFRGIKSSSPEPESKTYATSIEREPPPEPEVLKPPPRFERIVQPPPVAERQPPPPPPPAPEPVLEAEAGLAPPPPPPPAPELVLKAEAELAPAPEPPPLAAPAPAPQLVTEPESVPELVSAPPPEPEPAPVVVPDLDAITDGVALTVDELDALYKANRQGAHARLMGKTIVVKGFVEKVFIRDHIDVRYILLTGTNKKVVWPVRCTFTKENISSMQRLNDGQEVALRGQYDNYSKNIIFKDCVLA